MEIKEKLEHTTNYAHSDSEHPTYLDLIKKPSMIIESNVTRKYVIEIEENELWYLCLANQTLIKMFDVYNLTMEDVQKLAQMNKILEEKLPDPREEEKSNNVSEELDKKPESGPSNFVMGKGYVRGK